MTETESRDVTPGYWLCSGCETKAWGVEPDECSNCGATEYEKQEVELLS